MNLENIKRMQRRLGVVADGVWGPRSAAAVRSHLTSLMPVLHPFPSSSEAELLRFYGEAGDESNLTRLDVGDLGVVFENQHVEFIRVHERLADSLFIVLAELSRLFPDVLKGYAGVFMNRPMRGGTRPSLHARGAAIDLLPGTNGNLTPWPMKADMRLEVMEVFARQGWLPAGAFWGRDAMHFQATRPV